MEWPAASFVRRDRLGIVLALLAGLLFFIVGLRIYSLSHQTGGDATALGREQRALDYFDYIQAASSGFQEFYVQTAARGLQGTRSERERAVSAFSAADAYTARNGADFGLLPQWSAAQAAWRAFEQHPDDDTLAKNLSRHLTDVYNQLNEKSGLIYDPDMIAQNLSDALIQETPALARGVDRSAAIAMNYLHVKNISINQRLNLAILARGIVPSLKITRDELNILIEQTHNERDAYSANDIAQLQHALAIASPIGTYADFQLNRVLVAPTSVAEIQRYRIPAARAIRGMNGILADALKRNLERRIALEGMRRVLWKLAGIFAALFLVGVMLEIVNFVARQDRRELRRAQEESARLSAELAREHAENALALTEAQFRAVFDGASIGIAILDQSGALVDANSVFRDRFGRDAREFLDGRQEKLEQLLGGAKQLFEFEQHYGRHGRELWVDATISAVKDDHGATQFAMCMFRDITEAKMNERRLVHGATHDGLTGLPNRLFFEGQLRERFAETGTLLDSFFAVLVVNLDEFNSFNATLGHSAGDLILQTVSTRLRASLDPNDLVARLASDEFAILIRSLADILHVESVARRILTNVCKPIALGERAIFASCSIGIALGSATYEHAEDVMRDAGTAMSQAKATGGARYAVFDSNMHARSEQRLQLTTDLRLALDRNEFNLVYQPIVRVSDGTLVGCEALLRWQHPTAGLILPGEFITLAEQTGIAIPLGKFVFETAVSQLARWSAQWQLSDPPEFSMSINVSASEIFDADFEGFIVSTCASYGVDPRAIALEITESVVLDSNTHVNLLFEHLQREGFKICIDDFGTGYSSLRYLQQFRIDQLKIDRSFVAAPDGEIASEPIVRTLMTLAEAFDLRVVAEGVESKAQRDMLRQAGCRFAQGYFYSPPVPAEELARMYPEVLGKPLVKRA